MDLWLQYVLIEGDIPEVVEEKRVGYFREEKTILVRIKALAEKLIRYKGLEPNKDIEIKITGLRPGEKLYEERLMEEEGMQTTPNKLISIGKPLNIPESFLKDLDDLIKSAYNNDDEIKDKVAKIVTTYKVDKERIGK